MVVTHTEATACDDNVRLSERGTIIAGIIMYEIIIGLNNELPKMESNLRFQTRALLLWRRVEEAPPHTTGDHTHDKHRHFTQYRQVYTVPVSFELHNSVLHVVKLSLIQLLYNKQTNIIGFL